MLPEDHAALEFFLGPTGSLPSLLTCRARCRERAFPLDVRGRAGWHPGPHPTAGPGPPPRSVERRIRALAGTHPSADPGGRLGHPRGVALYPTRPPIRRQRTGSRPPSGPGCRREWAISHSDGIALRFPQACISHHFLPPRNQSPQEKSAGTLGKQNRARVEGFNRATGCLRTREVSEALQISFSPVRARFCHSPDFVSSSRW